MARTKSTAASQQRESEYDNQEAGRQAMEDSEPDTPRKMSKTDAIRAAMAEGIESPGDGVDFIRKRFGIEMSKQHFSATKSKLKSAEDSEQVRPRSPLRRRGSRSRSRITRRRPSSPPDGMGTCSTRWSR